MAKELFVLPQALDDLEAIFAYGVQAFGRDNAIIFLQKFQQSFSVLCQFDLGTSCEDIAPNLFRYVMGHYVIFFTRTSELVKIVRVLHGSQDINKQFS